jgi:hypothetical protein
MSAGIGTGTHLSVAQLNLDLGISATHEAARPTDAIAATIARVAAGEADYAMSPITPVAAAPRRAGVSGGGAPGFDFPIWYGIWAPISTPAHTVDELSTGIASALDAPELVKWLAEHGAEQMRMVQPEFAAFVERERDRAASIARAAGIATA